MDTAYDHIQEQAFPDEDERKAQPTNNQEAQASINADIQEAYKAFSNSPWGAKIGGFLGSVAKQGEAVYREAQQEVSTLGQEATRGWTDLASTIVQRTRSLSLNTTIQPADQATRSAPGAEADDDDQQTTPTKNITSDEALMESDTVLSRLKIEAAKRLKDIQKAEEAADDALLKFGSNIRDFLKDAISVTPPSNEPGADDTVLFESKDAQGKRVIHASRFDAQMHVIHTSTDGFLKDPSAAEYKAWEDKFDAEEKTEDISTDLTNYPELRATMEKLVPDTVPYAEFWKRYYFLRHSIETAEARRRDLLKAASAEEEVGWDEDSEDDSDEDSSDSEDEAGPREVPLERPSSTGSSGTIHAKPSTQTLKAAEPRKSNDEASDTSYDMVGAASGKPSQAPSEAPSEAPNSPKNVQKKVDDSDEDDEDDSEDDDSDSEEDWE